MAVTVRRRGGAVWRQRWFTLIGMVFLSVGFSCKTAVEEPLNPTREYVEGVELTWLSTTTWLVRYETTVLLLDAFFSRPLLAQEGSKKDGIERMERMLEAAGASSVDAILVGHSHYDHVVDVGTAALSTGAQVYGSKTTCLVAQSQGLPETRCTVIGQGDRLEIGDAAIDVIRTIHWWPDTNGIGVFEELTEVPSPIAASTAPNGGVLSLLFHFTQADEPVTVFYRACLVMMARGSPTRQTCRQLSRTWRKRACGLDARTAPMSEGHLMNTYRL